mgnify:CR=1 FL=1
MKTLSRENGRGKREMGLARVTIKDVAEAAGVGVSTASRALNNRRDVSEKTRRHVLAVAERLGYVPNSLARGLLLGKTKTIGVVVSSILNPFYAAVVAGIENRLSANDYKTLLFNSDEDPEQELAAVKMLMEQRVDGVILAPVAAESVTVEHLVDAGIPFVLVARTASHPMADYVVCDDFAIGHLATKALIDKGHKRILMVNSVGNSSAKLRWEGYRAALEEAGIPYDERLVRPVSPFEPVENAVSEALDEGLKPTAIFSFCDYMALGIMKVLRERRIRIPQDMALISCDNLDFTALLDPPLTTIHIPKYEIGVEAAEALLAKIEGDEERRERVVAPSLIERGSV